MAKDPLSFLREDFVALFNRGVSDLSQKATAGEAWAKARLEDVRAASGCAHFVLDGAGGGEVYLEIQNGEMKAHAQKPASPPTRLGVGGSAFPLQLSGPMRRFSPIGARCAAAAHCPVAAAWTPPA